MGSPLSTNPPVFGTLADGSTLTLDPNATVTTDTSIFNIGPQRYYGQPQQRMVTTHMNHESRVAATTKLTLLVHAMGEELSDVDDDTLTTVLGCLQDLHGTFRGELWRREQKKQEENLRAQQELLQKYVLDNPPPPVTYIPDGPWSEPWR